MTKYSFFSIKTQFENIGDALINREMIEMSAEHTNTFVDLSRCPKDFQKTLNLTSKNIKTVKSTFQLFSNLIVKAITKTDCYYFLSPGGYTGELSNKEYISKFVNYYILFILTKIFSVKICHIGVSYERIGPKHLNLLKKRSNLLHKHLVRDSLSREFAIKNGIEVDDIMPDLAFNIFSQKNYNLSKNTSICLSFRTDQFPNQLKQIKQFLEKLVEILPTNIELKFYAQVGRDVLNMQELTNHISHIKNKKYDLTISTNDLSDSYSFFQTCGLIISNRLHVLLMGGSRTGHIIACVSSSYNKKVEGIMSMLELDERVVLLDEKESHLIVKPHLQGDTENKIIGLDQHKKLKGVMIKLFETCRNDE